MTSVTGIILAGGRGRRMGGIDKGLVDLGGKPMVQHVIDRLAPQVDSIVINANQNLERYRAFGFRVIEDEIAGFAGPLAGLHAGMSAAATELVATVPCDSPFLPEDLIVRLELGMAGAQAELAVARTHDQPHPVFCIAHRRLLPHLEAFLGAGGRKIDAWYASLVIAEVRFDDEADAFRNINTRDELDAASPR